MPKFYNWFLGFVVYLGFSIWCLGFVPTALAATEESSNTPVTATVPTPTPTGEGTSTLSPSAPILLRPANGTVTSDSTPELVWRQSVDPDSNTVFYDLYLDNVATYLGVSNSGSAAGVGYTSTVYDNEVRLVPTSTLVDGTHSWWVRAYDLGGAWAKSVVWQFTIDTTPPFLVVTSVDAHHGLGLDSRNPATVPADTSFEVIGPKDIYFTVVVEPYSTLQLTFFATDGSQIAQTSLTADSDPTLYPYAWLTPGTYQVQAVAIDQALNTSALPTFTLQVNSAPSVTVPLPSLPGIPGLPTPPPTITLTVPPPLLDLPSTLAHLPASVARVSSRVNLAYILLTLIAIGTIILLILLWKRRYNLVLLNPQHQPLATAEVHHSLPAEPGRPHSRSRLSHHKLTETGRGRLYIPGLARYSTLTIQTTSTTVILSVWRFRSPLTLTVS